MQLFLFYINIFLKEPIYKNIDGAQDASIAMWIFNKVTLTPSFLFHGKNYKFVR